MAKLTKTKVKAKPSKAKPSKAKVAEPMEWTQACPPKPIFTESTWTGPVEEPGSSMHEPYSPPEIQIPTDSAILPSRRLSVYFASKIHHAKVAKGLLAEWSEFDWTARWVHMTGKVPVHLARIFWQHDHEDISKAEVVLVYSAHGKGWHGGADDVLRGALVEAGIGLGLGKTIILVGQNECYGTWRNHPQVLHAENLYEARQMLRTIAF